MSREFTVSKHSANGGNVCKDSKGNVLIGGEIETKECDTSPCPIDCEGSWGDWTDCSNAAQGDQKRIYNIARNPQYGGKACPKNNGDQEIQMCNTDSERTSPSGDSVKTYTIPGVKGTAGVLDIRARWWKGSGVRRTTGIDVWINDKHMVQWKRKESSMGWRRGDGVLVSAKSGDVIKVRDHGDRTFNANVYWRFKPGETGGSSDMQYPAGHKA
jgi:hypothetical protein